MFKLKSYKPGTLYQREKKNRLEYAKGSDFSEDYVDFELKCWDCKKKFLVAVSAANLHCSVWRCPHCEAPNETE